MTYRARRRLFNVAIAAPFYAFVGLGCWWILDAAGDDPAVIAARGGVMLAPFAVLFVVIFYWPTRRRPDRLYHLTSRAVAAAATVGERGADAVTVELRAAKRGKPTYFFSQSPSCRSVLYWNLDDEPEVCIELHDIDYRGVRVRRRLTGAYRLHGLTHAGATIAPFPAEDR